MCCAELNAIVSAFRYHADLTNSTLYTTGVPCPKCALTIVQSGIKTVVYGGKNEIEKSANKIAKLMEAADNMKVEDADNTAKVLKNVAEVMDKAVEVLKKKAAGETKDAAVKMEEFVTRMKGVVEKAAKDIETNPDQSKGEMEKIVTEMKQLKKEAEEEGKILAGVARFILDHIVTGLRLDAKDMVKEAKEIFYWAKVATL